MTSRVRITKKLRQQAYLLQEQIARRAEMMADDEWHRFQMQNGLEDDQMERIWDEERI